MTQRDHVVFSQITPGNNQPVVAAHYRNGCEIFLRYQKSLRSGRSDRSETRVAAPQDNLSGADHTAA
jgi:hypothetical protein